MRLPSRWFWIAFTWLKWNYVFQNLFPYMLPDECWPKRKYEWNWKVEGCLVRCWKRQTLRCWWIPAGPSLPTLHPAPLPSHWPLARAAPGPPPDSVATASIGSPSLCGCPTGAAGCAFGSSNSVLQEGWFETLLWSLQSLFQNLPSPAFSTIIEGLIPTINLIL